jgi:hypothetical protein
MERVEREGEIDRGERGNLLNGRGRVDGMRGSVCEAINCFIIFRNFYIF